MVLWGFRTRDEVVFKRSDAGRSRSRRPRQKNDCTVRALAVAAKLDYDAAYDLLKDAGRRSHRGFHFPSWAKTVVVNGYGLVRETFPARKGQPRMNVARFCRSHRRGRYIIQTAKHVAAVVDGVLYDDAEPDAGRCVYGCWRLRRHRG